MDRSPGPGWAYLSEHSSSVHSSDNEGDGEEVDDLQSSTRGSSPRYLGVARKSTRGRPPQRQQANPIRMRRNSVGGVEQATSSNAPASLTVPFPATQPIASSSNRVVGASLSEMSREGGSSVQRGQSNAVSRRAPRKPVEKQRSNTVDSDVELDLDSLLRPKQTSAAGPSASRTVTADSSITASTHRPEPSSPTAKHQVYRKVIAKKSTGANPHSLKELEPTLQTHRTQPSKNAQADASTSDNDTGPSTQPKRILNTARKTTGGRIPTPGSVEGRTSSPSRNLQPKYTRHIHRKSTGGTFMRRPDSGLSGPVGSQTQRRQTMPAESIEVITLSSSESDKPKKSVGRPSAQSGQMDDPLVIDSSDDERAPLSPKRPSSTQVRPHSQARGRSGSQTAGPSSVLDTPPAIRPIPRPKPRMSESAKTIPGDTRPLDLADRYVRKSPGETQVIVLSSDDDEAQTRAAPKPTSPTGRPMAGYRQSSATGPSNTSLLVKRSPVSPGLPQTSSLPIHMSVPAPPIAQDSADSDMVNFDFDSGAMDEAPAFVELDSAPIPDVLRESVGVPATPSPIQPKSPPTQRVEAPTHTTISAIANVDAMVGQSVDSPQQATIPVKQPAQPSSPPSQAMPVPTPTMDPFDEAEVNETPQSSAHASRASSVEHQSTVAALVSERSPLGMLKSKVLTSRKSSESPSPTGVSVVANAQSSAAKSPTQSNLASSITQLCVSPTPESKAKHRAMSTGPFASREEADAAMTTANLLHKIIPDLWASSDSVRAGSGSPSPRTPPEGKVHRSDFSELRRIRNESLASQRANTATSLGSPSMADARVIVGTTKQDVAAAGPQMSATGPPDAGERLSQENAEKQQDVVATSGPIDIDDMYVDENLQHGPNEQDVPQGENNDTNAVDQTRKRSRSRSMEVDASWEGGNVRPITSRRASKRARRIDYSSDNEVDASEMLAVASSPSPPPPDNEDVQAPISEQPLEEPPSSDAHTDSGDSETVVQLPSDGEQPDRGRRRTRSRSSGANDITDGIDQIDLSFDVQKKGGRMSVTPQRKVYGKEYAPPHVLARDVPCGLANIVNSMEWWARDPVLLREVFEDAMVANTTPDEPYAPDIHIFNSVDDEPTPPFEFYYSNLMWHGEGVPPPDWNNLQGCDCFGPCDPYGDCACAMRQREMMQDHLQLNGFIYDNKGRLKHHSYPIIECNDKCQCTDNCKNRVVQFGRKVKLNIVKTEKKGWGVFAAQRIPSGTFIGVYSGELITDSSAEIRGRLYNKVGRTYLFDLDFWHLQKNKDDVNYTVDAFHAGNFTRFVNHSCDPNAKINACYINEANLDKPLLVVFAVRDIQENEEISFSYYGDDDDSSDEEDEPAMGTKATGSKASTSKNSVALKDEVYQTCQCGARKCKGKIFT